MNTGALHYPGCPHYFEAVMSIKKNLKAFNKLEDEEKLSPDIFAKYCLHLIYETRTQKISLL